MIGLTPVIAATAGLFLNAFFSGTETGFYRAAKLRLRLDAMGGDAVSRGLYWLATHPAMFVATALVGNNLANYLTSLAIVMGTQLLVIGHGHTAEIVAPLVLTPILFVYGELLPKSLFLQAPNRLLRRAGPLFLFFVGLFFPISCVLWGLNKLLERLMGASPQQVRLTLVRQELSRALEEGHAAGILRPAQRGLAQGIFAVAQRPVCQFTTPLKQLPHAYSDMTKQDVLRLARRYRIARLPVESRDAPGRPIGYLRVIDLVLSDPREVGPLRPLLEIPADTSQIAALMRMQSGKESIALVTDREGETVGMVTADQLREPLFRGSRHP